MPCWSHRSEMGVCSRRWSRRMATFSWAVNRLRVFLAMGEPPLEIVAYSSGLFFPFRLKQNTAVTLHESLVGFRLLYGGEPLALAFLSHLLLKDSRARELILDEMAGDSRESGFQRRSVAALAANDYPLP